MSRSPHSATLIGGSLVVTGFVMLALGWRGGAATLFVPTQVAYGVSGGLIGLALIGTGLAVLAVQTTRMSTARRSAELQQLIGDTVEVFAAVRARTADGARKLEVPLPRRGMPAGSVVGDEPVLVSNGQGPASLVDDHAPYRPDVLVVPGAKSFHVAGCRVIAATDKVALHLSVHEAAAAGLRPCRICGPRDA